MTKKGSCQDFIAPINKVICIDDSIIISWDIIKDLPPKGLEECVYLLAEYKLPYKTYKIIWNILEQE